MNQRSSSLARIFAVTALVVAAIAAIVVIGSAGGGGDSSGSGKRSGQAAHKSAKAKRNVPASYVVQSGDTLVSIAHRTGVPVVRIQALNPQVDPQILIAGEKLKLR